MTYYIKPTIKKRLVDFEGIKYAVTDYLEINPALLDARFKKSEVIFARQLISYFSRRYTFLVYKSIAEKLNTSFRTACLDDEAIKKYLHENEIYTTLVIKGVIEKLNENYRVVER